MNRRNFLAAIGGTLGTTFSGCASWDPGGAPGPSAEAPTYRVGDRWVYRWQDGFRVQIVWDETHEVTAVGPQGIAVRVSAKGPTVDVERIEQWVDARRRPCRRRVRTRNQAVRAAARPLPLPAGARRALVAARARSGRARRGRMVRSTAMPWSAVTRRSPRRPGSSTRSACACSCASTTRRSGATRPSATISSGMRPRSAPACASFATPSTRKRDRAGSTVFRGSARSTPQVELVSFARGR